MRARIVPLGALLRAAVLAGIPAQVGAAEKAVAPPARTVTIEMREGLRFAPVRLVAHPGETVTLKLVNHDPADLPHNFVLLRPGTRAAVVEAATALGERGPERAFVPDHPAVLAHSALVPAEKELRVTVTFPAEPAVYPYVCTYPGHGVIMYGAAYVGVPLPPVADDPNLPPAGREADVPGGGRRPFVQRMFMPDAGPASIAVALRGSQNVCWDAGSCRLRYAWQGGFIDASEHWRGTGAGKVQLGAKPWWTASAQGGSIALAGAGGGASRTVRFRGYRWLPDGAEFHYEIDGVPVQERITPGERPGVRVEFSVAGGREVVFHAEAGANAVWLDEAGRTVTGKVPIPAAGSGRFAFTLTSPLCSP